MTKRPMKIALVHLLEKSNFLDMRFFIPLLAPIFFVSCAGNQPNERRPVPPQGSDIGSKPWNDPSVGPRPQGILGGMEQGR
jgi:hypothetical protein